VTSNPTPTYKSARRTKAAPRSSFQPTSITRKRCVN